MIDARNNGNLTCGITQDPELVNDGKILRLRVAVDYAGNDRKNPDNKSGYFNVTYFLNNDNPNAKFVKSQVDNGNLKKGSQVQIVYRLQQDRWEKDGQNMSMVGLVAESLTYAGSAPKSDSTSESSNEGSMSSGSSENIPTEF